MARSRSRASSGRIGARILLFASVLVALFAAAGASYQAIASHLDAKHFSHPGRLVGAGGLRLNLYCAGRGKPTVVLEAGLADSLETWRSVRPAVARFAHVCSYDRAGYGYTDSGPMPRTSDRIASELHAALRSAGESRPMSW